MSRAPSPAGDLPEVEVELQLGCLEVETGNGQWWFLPVHFFFFFWGGGCFFIYLYTSIFIHYVWKGFLEFFVFFGCYLWFLLISMSCFSIF